MPLPVPDSRILWQDPRFVGLIPSAYVKPKHHWSTVAFVRRAAGLPESWDSAAQQPEELPLSSCLSCQWLCHPRRAPLGMLPDDRPER